MEQSCALSIFSDVRLFTMIFVRQWCSLVEVMGGHMVRETKGPGGEERVLVCQFTAYFAAVLQPGRLHLPGCHNNTNISHIWVLLILH